MPVLLILLLVSIALAQPDDIQKSYAQLCSGCHGADARGSQQGPGLAGNLKLRRRTPQALRNIITRGVPAAGMPGFKLPDATLDGLVQLVVSFNSSAADAKVAGDRAAGSQFFFGSGKCSTCHMINGQGAPIGPDLTTIGRDQTLDQIRASLLSPSAAIVPGYRLVTLKQPNRPARRGFARSRTSFHLAIQDLSGVLHSHSLSPTDQITEDPTSPMPALNASPADMQNLLAFLANPSGIVPPAVAHATPAAIPFSRIESPRPGEWLSFNGSLDGNRYSPLTQINAANVRRLKLAWTFTVPLWQQFLPDTPYFHENMRYFGLETVPLVVDGIMYATGPNQVFALDAATGALIWQFQRPRTPGLVSDPSLGTNRGVALLGDSLFFVTDNAHLLAIHRTTGKLIWEVTMWDEAQKYGGTVSPLIVKDMVVAGVAGGDWGIRGFVAAYKAATGERLWRHWTVPAEGEPGIETWQGPGFKLGGGSTWLTGAYDPATNLLYWATGNPWPNSDDSQRPGDNLFTDSVLALDADAGKLKWYHQFTPHDTHDWDANVPNVLVDTTWRGQPRKLLLHADRNGFFYVFDRTDGKLLLGKSFMRKMTWATGLDAKGRPIKDPKATQTCPDHATNWHSTVFSPTTRLYYVIATEKCTTNLLPGSWKTAPPPDQPGQKFLRALNIETGEIAWDIPQIGPADGKRYAGLLGTAGHLLFYGDASGYFIAADERTGQTRWNLPLNATIKTSPMSYAVNGKQFITIAVGANILTFSLPEN